MKECVRCGKMKSYKEFSPSKNYKDGYVKECKVCRNLKMIEYRKSKKDRNNLENKKVDEYFKFDYIPKTEKEGYFVCTECFKELPNSDRVDFKYLCKSCKNKMRKEDYTNPKKFQLYIENMIEEMKKN